MNEKSTKVLVCGAFSTGKTTLVEALTTAFSAAGRTITVCSDAARACPLPLNHDQTFETSLWLATEQIRREIEAVARGSDFVLCDRGLPDILSHHAEIASPPDVALNMSFQNFAAAWCATYTLVFHAAVDDAQPIADDGTRVVDPTYRRTLDTAIRDVLRAVGVDAHILPFNMAERLTYVSELLNDHNDQAPRPTR